MIYITLQFNQSGCVNQYHKYTVVLITIKGQTQVV